LQKDIWCEFHKGFGHDVDRCIALGNQLAGLVKDRFLKEYLEENQETKQKVAPGDQVHEVPVHSERNTISGGFLGERCTASKRKKYVREVMAIKVRKPGKRTKLTLCFTSSDLEDVVPHEDDPVVISVVTVGRRVHRVPIDHGSLADVMFWLTFNNL